MNDIVTREENGPVTMAQPPTRLGHGANVGAIAIESERAIAEARGKMQLAKMFPRSVAASIAEFLDACRSPDFAKTAFYSVPNRGTGPSIRFAEEAARCYGNFDYGHRELSRSEGKSEIEVYAWDKEKNNESRRQITVMHIRDAGGTKKVLRDEADIDNRIANVASKQMRGRILALMPKHLVAMGVAECKRTIAGGNEKPLPERIAGMCSAFNKIGVTTAKLAAWLEHSIDDTSVDELADLHGIFNAIKEGAKADDYFDAPKPPVADNDNTPQAALTSTDGKPHAAAAAAQKRTAKATPSPAPAPTPVATPAPAPQPAPAPAAAEPPPVEAGDPGAQGGDFF